MSSYNLRAKIYTHDGVPEHSPLMPEQHGAGHGTIYLNPKDFDRLTKFIVEEIYDAKKAEEGQRKLAEEQGAVFHSNKEDKTNPESYTV